MSEFVYIGKIVNTHGIKGELRLLSNFQLKNKVFNPGNTLYIGKNYEEKKIVTYRHHKIFDMVTFEGVNNINEVLSYIKMPVYFKRSDLNLKDDEFLIDDLINFNVVEDEKILGKISNISYNNGNVLLYVNGEKNFYIPYNASYIKNVNIANKTIITENAKELIL